MIQKQHIVPKTIDELLNRYNIEEDYSFDIDDKDKCERRGFFTYEIYENIDWCHNEARLVSYDTIETTLFLKDLYNKLKNIDEWDYVEQYGIDRNLNYDEIYVYW